MPPIMNAGMSHRYTNLVLISRRFSRKYSGHAEDTIFALSTPPGKSAIAVFRLTGPQSRAALSLMTVAPIARPALLRPRSIVHPVTRQLLDKGMTVHFQGPASNTGEDVVELHVHGGRATVAAVTGALASLPTHLRVRAAQPGEFTRRAFLSGKLDLTAVEGLADLVNADTEAQRRQALRQASGELASLYDNWRAELLVCCAHAEAVLDFAADQDGVDDDAITAGITARVQALLGHMRAHLSSSRRGEVVRDGIALVILGPPNAGKSSLLNYIARRPAAIVSPIPGTTRDVMEVRLDLGGLTVILADTAGLRESPCDSIEAEGILRAQARAETAHIRLILLDQKVVQSVSSSPFRESYIRYGDIPTSLLPFIASTGTTLVVLNKCDDHADSTDEGLDDSGAKRTVGANLVAPPNASYVRVHRISCLTGAGIPSLLSLVESAVHAQGWAGSDSHTGMGGTGVDAPVITRSRHRSHVEACVACLERFVRGGLPPDASAEELRQACHSLASLTGRMDVEELLDVIFRDFCIGK